MQWFLPVVVSLLGANFVLAQDSLPRLQTWVSFGDLKVHRRQNATGINTDDKLGYFFFSLNWNSLTVSYKVIHGGGSTDGPFSLYWRGPWTCSAAANIRPVDFNQYGPQSNPAQPCTTGTSAPLLRSLGTTNGQYFTGSFEISAQEISYLMRQSTVFDLDAPGKDGQSLSYTLRGQIAEARLFQQSNGVTGRAILFYAWLTANSNGKFSNEKASTSTSHGLVVGFYNPSNDIQMTTFLVHDVSNAGRLFLRCPSSSVTALQAQQILDGDQNRRNTNPRVLAVTQNNLQSKWLFDSKIYKDDACYYRLTSSGFPDGELFGAVQHFADFDVYQENGDGKRFWAPLFYMEDRRTVNGFIVTDVNKTSYTGFNVSVSDSSGSIVSASINIPEQNGAVITTNPNGFLALWLDAATREIILASKDVQNLFNGAFSLALSDSSSGSTVSSGSIFIYSNDMTSSTDSINSLAIGLGVGLGLVALIGIGVGVFFVMRRGGVHIGNGKI